VLPIVTVTSNLIHFLFGLPILLLFVPVLGKGYTIYMLQLPIVIFVQYIFSLGFSFLVSSLTVHFRDIKDILANVLTFWFFASPIIYSMDFPPIQQKAWLKTILHLNPLTHIMQGYQNCVFFGKPLLWKNLGITLFLSLVLFFIGYYIFDRLRDSFPEEV